MAEINDTLKSSTTKGFGSVGQRNFTENLDTPHPLIYTFSIPEINERLEGPPTAFFHTVGQKLYGGNLDTSPYLLSIKFSATRKILKHSTEGFLYEMLPYCETKSFRRNILVIPPPS